MQIWTSPSEEEEEEGGGGGGGGEEEEEEEESLPTVWYWLYDKCDLSKENQLLTPRFAEMLTLKL